jgi:hypothetical protein
MKSGRPGKEIIRYVKKHRNVVLAIYDTATEENSICSITPEEGDGPLALGKYLSVPLVMLRNQG